MKNREKSFERILPSNAEPNVHSSIGSEVTQGSQPEQGQQQQIYPISIPSQQATLRKNRRQLLNEPPNHTNLIDSVSSKNKTLHDPSQLLTQAGSLSNCLQEIPKKNTHKAIFQKQLKKQSKKTLKKSAKKSLCYPSSPPMKVNPCEIENNNICNNKNVTSSQENELPRFQDSKQLSSQQQKLEATPKGLQNGENISVKGPSERLSDRSQYHRIPLQPFSPNFIDIQSQNQLLSVIKSNPKNEPTEDITYLDSSAQKQQQHQQQQQYLFTTPNKQDTQFLRYGSASQQVLGSMHGAFYRPKSFGSPDHSPDQRDQENQLFKSTYPGEAAAIEKIQGGKHHSSNEKKTPWEQSQQNYCQSSFVSLPDGHVAEYDSQMNYQGFQTQQEASQLAQSFYSVATQQFYQTQGQQLKQGQGINHRNANIPGSTNRNYNNVHPQLVQCASNGGDGNIYQTGVAYSSLFLDITQIQPQQQQPKQNGAQQSIVYEDNQQLFGQQKIQQTPLSVYPTQNVTVGYQFGSYASFGQRSARQQIFPNQVIVGYSSENSIQNNNTNSHINFDERQEEFSLDEYQNNMNTLERHSDSENNEGEEEDGNESCSGVISSIGSIEGKTEEQQEQEQDIQKLPQIREKSQQKQSNFENEDDEEVILSELPKKRRIKGKNIALYLKQQQKLQPPAQPLERKRRVSKKKLNSLSKDDSEEHQGLDSSKPTRNNTNTTAARNKYDTKNLVKNFLNQFLSFASSTDPKEQAEVCSVLNVENKSLLSYQERLRQFLKHRKYNRQLFKEFIHIEQFRELFAYFLCHKAEQWIQNGRMKDKLSHFRALSNFKYISQNHDTVKSWRFRYNFV